MDVLVLGGTSFVGRGIVEDLLERGHTPTLFNRGRTGTDLFPGIERLVGDRAAGDYAALDGHRWDAVVDVNAYVPRHAAQAVAALGSHSGRYLFISTGLVYDHTLAADRITEASARVPATGNPNRSTTAHMAGSKWHARTTCARTSASG
jgi:nucleoside-diphosphate-sugar epimerase